MATVHETYAAALQHDQADLPAGTRLVGVVRRPMGWFYGVVDRNIAELGPPEDLLDAVKDRQSALRDEGFDDADASHRAWDDVDFAARYKAYLDDDPTAAQATANLIEAIRGGPDIALVCYEAADKPCHRHILRTRLLDRLEASGA